MTTVTAFFYALFSLSVCVRVLFSLSLSLSLSLWRARVRDDDESSSVISNKVTRFPKTLLARIFLNA